jgi:hypothetical protein
MQETAMPNKPHKSFRAKPAKPARTQSPAQRRAAADDRLAEGLRRPAPGLEPPLREDAWIDQRIADQKACEEADRQARQTEEPDSD